MSAQDRDILSAEAALASAEREGFRLAVTGRTGALVLIAVFYLAVYSYPNNVYVGAAVLATAAIGLIPLLLVDSRYERHARFILFTFDAAAASAILAFAPLSSGGDIPQNLVFLSSRTEYYYVIVATSILTLSPGLVSWTGLCAIVGLASATAWIVSGMDRVVSLGNLPPSPSRDEVFAVLLSPNYLGIPVRVIEGCVIGVVTCIAALAVHRARNVVRAHVAAERERFRVEKIFGRYVPPQVADQLIQTGQLAPQQREATILFADIEGFTSLSETLTPTEVVSMLNSLFREATALVDRHGGVVINYIGDALIAAFNAPLPVKDHAARAVETAKSLLVLMDTNRFEGHRLRLRIGVATGPVSAGTVGGDERLTYTLYGDTVNLAQRLERLNKELDTDCLICETTYAAAPAPRTATALGAVQVRGREHAVNVYALSV
jgi:class 3 adenylate cyclase